MPTVYSIMSNRNFTRSPFGVFGSWSEAHRYMLDNLSIEHSKNTTKLGNKVAIEMLSKAVEANPKEIGRPFTIWHVLSKHIDKLEEGDIKLLDRSYGLNYVQLTHQKA